MLFQCMILLGRLSSESLSTDVLALLLRVVSLRWAALKPQKLRRSLIGASSQPEWIVSILLFLADSSVVSFLQVFLFCCRCVWENSAHRRLWRSFFWTGDGEPDSTQTCCGHQKSGAAFCAENASFLAENCREDRSRDILEWAFDDGIVWHFLFHSFRVFLCLLCCPLPFPSFSCNCRFYVPELGQTRNVSSLCPHFGMSLF